MEAKTTKTSASSGDLAQPLNSVVNESTDAPAKGRKASSKVVTIELTEQLTLNGREITELSLDFRKLSARTLRNLEDEIREGGEAVIPNPILSSTYCQYIGARAAGLAIDDFDDLCYEDTMQVVQAVQNFSAKSAARSRQK